MTPADAPAVDLDVLRIEVERVRRLADPEATHVPDPARVLPFDVPCEDCDRVAFTPCAHEPRHAGAYHTGRVLYAQRVQAAVLEASC